MRLVYLANVYVHILVAVFRRFFGATLGISAAPLAMTAWVATPTGLFIRPVMFELKQNGNHIEK